MQETGSTLQFLEIIQEFDARQRKAFLLFVTGAPRLPPGGLAALKPKLTIVCKVHSSLFCEFASFWQRFLLTS